MKKSKSIALMAAMTLAFPNIALSAQSFSGQSAQLKGVVQVQNEVRQIQLKGILAQDVQGEFSIHVTVALDDSFVEALHEVVIPNVSVNQGYFQTVIEVDSSLLASGQSFWIKSEVLNVPEIKASIAQVEVKPDLTIVLSNSDSSMNMARLIEPIDYYGTADGDEELIGILNQGTGEALAIESEFGTGFKTTAHSDNYAIIAINEDDLGGGALQTIGDVDVDGGLTIDGDVTVNGSGIESAVTVKNGGISIESGSFLRANGAALIGSDEENNATILYAQPEYGGYRFLDRDGQDIVKIKNNGFIGVGTTEPNTGLTLAPTHSAITVDTKAGFDDKSLILSGSGGTGETRGALIRLYGTNSEKDSLDLLSPAGGNGISLRTGGDIERMNINDQGQVKIGSIQEEDQTSQLLQVAGSGVFHGNLFLGHGGESKFAINTGAVDSNQLGVSASETGSYQLIINENGNVGIGADIPQDPLHVYDAVDSGIRVTRAGAAHNSRMYSMWDYNGGVVTFGTNDEDDLYFVTHYISEEQNEEDRVPPRMTISKDGDVGIGIGANRARAILHVADQDDSQIRLQRRGRPYDDAMYSSWEYNEGEVIFGTNRGDDLHFVTDFRPEDAPQRPPRMTIDRHGLVGIGQPAPQAELHIASNATTALDVDANQGHDAVVRFHTVGANRDYRGQVGWVNGKGIVLENGDNNSSITFKNNGQDYLTIAADGVIHIAKEISIDGKVVGEELFIQDVPTWPDYVFEENYDLMSLSEIEEFVKRNKHLPEVPSAKTVEEGGLNVASISAKLLQKVEELTLHMIEMEKKYNALEEENKALRNTINQL